MINYIIIIFLIFLFLILYRSYEKKQLSEESDYSMLRKYLIKGTTLATNKPILWIYIPSMPNTRHPKKFGDGHTNAMNQEYVYITIKSIIKANDKSFTICIIDNKSFNKIIPGWEYDLNNMASPIFDNLLNLALAKTLYLYGGILVPYSFLCFRDLIEMYDYGTRDNKLFICENINKSITSHEFTTDRSFMGCKKENPLLHEYIKYSQVIISTDMTDNVQFSGIYNEWFYNHREKLVVINGKRIGTKTKAYNTITMEDLFSETYIPLSKESYGIYIPSNEIIQRSNYEWFTRLSKKEVLSGNTNIQKYMLLTCANAPPVYSWMSFWKVPSDYDSFKPKPY